MGNYYLVINYLFTIWQVSQTPSTIGQPSILEHISTDSNSLGVVTICKIGSATGLHDKLLQDCLRYISNKDSNYSYRTDT